MTLSAVVIALNEEKNLPACLEGLGFADEIVVVDSGSIDRTLETARGYTGKVFKRAFDDFSSQKNFALSKASGDWVLSIDADERVSRMLADEILAAIGQDSFEAYEIQRLTRLFGRVFRYSGLQSDRPVRLFKKDRGSFEGRVHERVHVRGRIGRLHQPLEHASFQTLEEYMRRLEQYTALEPAGVNGRPGLLDYVARPGYRFCSMYFWKQGFRDGREGAMYCALSAFYEFVKCAKLRKQGSKP